jgi:metal-responsive CopG/Arc/MetJ family transcriptional regulator
MANSNFNWSKQATIRAPDSVVKQLDKFKKKHGFTSRPQAIIAALERAEKNYLIEEIKEILKDFQKKKKN